MTEVRHDPSFRRRPESSDSDDWTHACANLEHYTDDQVACWDNADKLDADERNRIMEKFQPGMKPTVADVFSGL